MPELRVDSLAFGGDAVGRLEGKVVFVPYGAPGDTVEIELLEQHPSYCRARIVRLLEPGPDRRDPDCHHFGHCGGCHWQHVAYRTQAASKHAIFERAMLEAGVAEVRRLTEAREVYGYRRRARLHWEVQGGAVALGYYQRGTRTLLDVERCPLLVEPLQQALAECRAALGGLGHGRGNLAVLADGDQHRVHVSLRLAAGSAGGLAALCAALERSSTVAGGQLVTEGGRRSFGAAQINLRLREERPLWGTGGTFAQVNLEQDRILRRRLEQWAEAEGVRVLELFAGVGNLTTGVGRGAAAIVAVEASRPAAELLRRNLEPLGGRVRAMRGDAAGALRKLAAAGERFDVVVMDPPREGSTAVADLIASVAPRRVVYVSCDPMTMARDLRRMAKRGLRPRRAQGIDMMPQTFHVEGLALLERGRGL